MKTFFGVNLCLIIFFSNWGLAQQSTYAGMEDREIKSLSEEQIVGYFEGRGMGMALSAELNNYPGPKHVLELKDSLKVSGEQEERINAIFEEMHDEAVKLGKSIVEKERELDHRFASGEITENSLALLINELSDLKGKLRFAHLNAHLKMVEVLDPTQMGKYSKLRGYRENSIRQHHLHKGHIKN